MTGNNRHINVIVTDDDTALKRALSQVFPEVQQQLCLWHVQKNVLKNVAEKSVSPPANTPQDPPQNAPQSAVPTRVSDLARPSTSRLEAQANFSVEHTQNGLLYMWVRVCWATDAENMRQKWTALSEEFEPDQHGTSVQFPSTPAF